MVSELDYYVKERATEKYQNVPFSEPLQDACPGCGCVKFATALRDIDYLLSLVDGEGGDGCVRCGHYKNDPRRRGSDGLSSFCIYGCGCRCEFPAATITTDAGETPALPVEGAARHQRGYETWASCPITGRPFFMNLEVQAVLNSLGIDYIRVCEAGGPEDIYASLAVSVARLQKRAGDGAAVKAALIDRVKEMRDEARQA